MKTRNLVSLCSVALALFVFGCAAADNTEENADERNLTLPPAESLATELADQPADGEAEAAEDDATPPPPRPRPREEPRTPPPPPSLAAGTEIVLLAADTLTSRHQEAGTVVRAFNAEAITNAAGDTVVPAEALWVGTITEIAASGGEDDDGVLVIDYTEIEFGDRTVPVEASFVSSEAFVKNRGFGAGDAAKVGAGAVVGAIAGRVLGGNRRGTIVGAVAGAAAGVGIMAATRPEDIILPAGFNVTIRLDDALVKQE